MPCCSGSTRRFRAGAPTSGPECLPALYVGDRNRPDPVGSYLAAGAGIQAQLLRLLPDGYDFRGRRVLDFGCGSGRVLRHFVDEAHTAEFHGCDIHEESIRWLQEHLSPPLHGHLTGPNPPLPFPDGHFDVIWTTSVFTHLVETWSAWLLEMHRVLKPDGILIATFIGPGLYTEIAHEPWVEDRVGMNVLGVGQPWDVGGPMVFHSPWWLHAHWGRLFEIAALEETGFGGATPDSGQGVCVLRPRGVTLTEADLEAPEPDEPRELIAMQHSISQLWQESRTINEAHDRYALAYAEEMRLRRQIDPRLFLPEWARRPLRRAVRSGRRAVARVRRQP